MRKMLRLSQEKFTLPGYGFASVHTKVNLQYNQQWIHKRPSAKTWREHIWNRGMFSNNMPQG
jgi:hypothetical protein